MESVAEFDGTLLAGVHRILHHFHKVTVIHDFERFISCAALARYLFTKDRRRLTAALCQFG